MAEYPLSFFFVSRQQCDEKSVAVRNQRREERNAESAKGEDTSGENGDGGFRVDFLSEYNPHRPVAIRFVERETARRVRTW